MENELLKGLYDCFYTPPELSEQENEVEECHKALIEALAKPERPFSCRTRRTGARFSSEEESE